MRKKDIIIDLLAAILLALILAPFASPWPDGLEKVAEDKGFLKKANAKPVLTSPIPDYTWPGLKNESVATSAAGIFGTLLVFGMGYGIAAIIKRGKSTL